MQTERGIALLKAGDRTQLEFVQQFAQENSIITTGGYNFTTSEAQLAIPNVPRCCSLRRNSPCLLRPGGQITKQGYGGKALHWIQTLRFDQWWSGQKSLWKCRIIPRNMGLPFRRSISSVSPTGKHWTTKIKSLSKRFPPGQMPSWAPVMMEN